jgi:hypothetical protein
MKPKLREVPIYGCVKVAFDVSVSVDVEDGIMTITSNLPKDEAKAAVALLFPPWAFTDPIKEFRFERIKKAKPCSS